MTTPTPREALERIANGSLREIAFHLPTILRVDDRVKLVDLEEVYALKRLAGDAREDAAAALATPEPEPTEAINFYRHCPQCHSDEGMGLVIKDHGLAIQCLCGFRGPAIAIPRRPAACNGRMLDKFAIDAWNDIPRDYERIALLERQLELQNTGRKILVADVKMLTKQVMELQGQLAGIREATNVVYGLIDPELEPSEHLDFYEAVRRLLVFAAGPQNADVDAATGTGDDRLSQKFVDAARAIVGDTSVEMLREMIAKQAAAEPSIPVDGRYVCTKGAPWDSTKGDRAHHPDAFSVGECSDGCCDYWNCPNCGLHFKTEVGQ